MKKTLSIMAIIMMVVCTLGTTVNATTTLIKPSDITAQYNSAANTGITTIGGKIIGAISTVGVILSVVLLSILGIKYMLGSAEEKAEYKKSLMPYIVGSVFVFGASTIAGIVYNMVTTL